MKYKPDLIAKRLQEARRHREMSLRELASRVDLTASTLSRYESGEIARIKLPVISRIATVLNVDPLWLVGVTDVMAPARPEPNTKVIPILGTIAAGIPIFAEQNISDWYSIDERLHVDFALLVKGDSMVDAKIYDGDIALIRRQPVVENGEIAAVLLEEDATLKRWYQTNREVILQSANEKYPPRVIRNGLVKVLGKLVGVYSSRE